MPPRPRGSGLATAEIRAAIEAFLRNSRQPALLEPGEDPIALANENYALEERGDRLTLQAWDRTRNLTRRVTGIKETSPARVQLAVQRFGGRDGQLFLLDLARRAGAEMGRKSGRLIFRERFRLFLRAQFPDWTLAELSAEPDLHHSLSPSFPRAFLKHGRHGWAAIACPSDGDSAAVLTFGLIWLSYLRQRERKLVLQGLAIYVPAGSQHAPALRLLCLDSTRARFELFAFDEHDSIVRIDPRDHGNLDTRLDLCRRAPADWDSWRSILDLPGVECIQRHDGRASLRVRGIEFAELRETGLFFGLGEKHHASDYHLPEIVRLVEELDRARHPAAEAREHALYRQFPEAWLESQTRAQIATADASLLPAPIYGQVPAFAGGDRGIMDLLAVDGSGRLAVLELKASEDVHLPLQALDYWIRVKWHLDRREFSPAGYFPGIELRADPPKLLLVAPALEFHPATETLLSYFAPSIEVERVGVAADWRRELRVMFRLRGAERP